MDDENVFSFLNDIRKKLLQNYDYEKLSTFAAFQLNEFTDNLRQYIVNSLNLILKNYYNTKPGKNKAGEVIADLNAAKSAIVESIDKLLDREQKLHLIVTKSDNLGKMSQNISNFVNFL